MSCLPLDHSQRVCVKHINDEVDTVAETIIRDGAHFHSILIHNTSSNTLYVSFDGGSTWKQISAGSTLEITAPSNKQIWLTEPLKLKASGASSTFEILLLQDAYAL